MPQSIGVPQFMRQHPKAEFTVDPQQRAAEFAQSAISDLGIGNPAQLGEQDDQAVVLGQGIVLGCSRRGIAVELIIGVVDGVIGG